MKCQEEMEYMQRCLDGDLNEQEHRMMQQHIEQCTSCMLMFERLNRLSEELVNLPKVTPPYNIVDSILPVLDELDHQQAAKPNTVWHRFWRRRAYRAVGGAFVASLVLVVFIWYGPLQSPSQDYANHATSGTATSSSDDTGRVMISMSSPSSNTGDDSMSFSSESSDLSMDEAPVVNQSSVKDQMGEALEKQPTQAQEMEERASRSGMATGHSVASPEAARQIAPDSSATRLEDHESQGFQDAVSNQDATVAEEHRLESSSHAQENATPESGEAMPPMTIQGMGAVELANDISKVVPSPEGTYAAFAEFSESEMQMIILNQEGKRIYASPSKQAVQLMSMSWSDTGNELSYTISDGSEETSYTIQVDNRVEIKHD